MPPPIAEAPSTPVDARTVNSMAERVAILETRVGSLKEDTVSIRTNIHGINNEMQKFVAAEMRCVDHLGKILEAIKDLPVILRVGRFRPAVRNDRWRGRGADDAPWRYSGRACLAGTASKAALK